MTSAEHFVVVAAAVAAVAAAVGDAAAKAASAYRANFVQSLGNVAAQAMFASNQALAPWTRTRPQQYWDDESQAPMVSSNPSVLRFQFEVN